MSVIVAGETLRLLLTDPINTVFEDTASIKLRLMAVCSFSYVIVSNFISCRVLMAEV